MAPLKPYLEQKTCKWQFVEPSNHRVNTTERAIYTRKNHIISGLCLTDKEWLLQLWDQLPEQGIITLNLCRTSQKDPALSAYHSFHGKQYDWNTHTMAPPGTRTVVYKDPTTRRSRAPHGLNTWYCDPAFDHYSNMKFFCS